MQPTMTEGPLGFPLTAPQARALEAVLKALPRGAEFAYRKKDLSGGPEAVLPGERADVSWISTEEPDRAGDVVLAGGCDDRHYRLNPIVTLNHRYDAPPVGRSLWRKAAHAGGRRGVKAKTQYPPRPADWAGAEWPPDAAFALVQSGLLRGKSIGFLPVKVHVPTVQERQQPGWDGVQLVIDEWLLLEYACCYLPVQQAAVVETVSKALAAPLRLTPVGELARGLGRRLAALDVEALARRAVERALGRV
jgi:hypothetical protein